MYPIRLYLRHPANVIMIGGSVVLNLATWIWPFWQIGPQTENIFLHYTVLYGVDSVGEWWRVFYLAMIGAVIVVVNTTLGWLFFERDTMIASMVLAMGVLCQIFLLIAVSLLVFLNV